MYVILRKHAYRGKVVSSNDFDIDKLRVITDVSVSSGYKYVGLLQDILSVNSTVTRNIITEYRSHCCRIQVSGHNKIIALQSQ